VEQPVTAAEPAKPRKELVKVEVGPELKHRKPEHVTLPEGTVLVMTITKAEDGRLDVSVAEALDYNDVDFVSEVCALMSQAVADTLLAFPSDSENPASAKKSHSKAKDAYVGKPLDTEALRGYA
jgi:hypothetical protein